jgi:FkbM family methyltransferase
MGFVTTYRFLASHPLTRSDKLKALRRWAGWQLASRIAGYPMAVSFVDDMRLLVSTGMTGATGNIYTGLHEFEDMAFALHFLRAGDLFVDIGANIGSYSILAAAAGADVISFEPIPATFEVLLDNIHLNRLDRRVDARNQAVGRGPGTLKMISDQDTTNQALPHGDAYAGRTVEVEQVALDIALRRAHPRMLKIDVEGFESEVLAGGMEILAHPALQAVLLELNGSGGRYGFDEDGIAATMKAAGFVPAAYDPLQRKLRGLDQPSFSGNTLFLRSIDAAQSAVSSARRFRVLGQDL